MRAAIYALMTTLCFLASPAWARNGETGILIVVSTFEFAQDAEQHTTLILCSEDLERIRELLKEGFTTSIYLPGYGVFEVEATEEGTFKLYQNNIGIESRDCHPSQPGLCA